MRPKSANNNGNNCLDKDYFLFLIGILFTPNTLKNIFLHFTFLFVFFSSFGQVNVDMKRMQWDVGSIQSIFNHRVAKMIGGNSEKSVTNLGYQNLQDLTKEIEGRVMVEGWSKEVINQMQFIYNTFFQGGLLHFYVSRENGDAANARNFEIEILDSVNQVILFKQRLTDDPSNPPPNIGKLYWNYFTVPIPIGLPATFYVNLIDYSDPRQRKYSFVVQTSI